MAWLMGSSSSRVLTMDTMGVMPEPAAMKQCFLFIVIGVKDKIALGAATSTRSPAFQLL